MKKVILLLGCVCLLLCSCTLESTTEISSADKTELGDDSGVSVTQEPKYDEQDNGVEVVMDESGFFIAGGLPEIGEFSGGKTGERFYQERTYHFIPSEDYGMIVPYVGESKLYSTDYDEYNTSMSYNSMGFCTFDGKIVMDASERVSHIYTETTTDGFTYYQYSVEPENHDDSYYTIYESHIVPSDGSWIIDIPGSSWVNYVGNGVISVMMTPEGGDPGVYYEPEKMVVYGYDGNVISEIYGVKGWSNYENGYFVLSFNENYESISESDTFEEDRAMTTPAQRKEDEYYYVNIQGERVAGPYKSAETFNKFGVACVVDFDGECYLIDKNFNRLTDKTYSRISKEGNWNDPEGLKYFSALVSDSETDRNYNAYGGTRDIYYGDGTYIGTVTHNDYVSLMFFDDGRVMYAYSYFDNNQYMRVYKGLDGSTIYNEEYGVSPNSYGNEPEFFVYRNFSDNSAVVMDEEGNTIVYAEDFNTCFQYSDERGIAVYSTGSVDYNYNEVTQENEVSDTTVLHIYAALDKKELARIEGSGSARFCDDDKRYLIITMYDPRDVMGGISHSSLYDTENECFVFEECKDLQCFEINGKVYFSVSKGHFSTLYDEELNVIVRNINE